MAKHLKVDCDFVDDTASETALLGMREKSRDILKRVLDRSRIIDAASVVRCDEAKTETRN